MAQRKPSSSYHHGDLREALLDEALRIIEHESLEELSLRELARRLGVSSAAPYHHFHDRAELLLAAAARLWERFEIQLLEERERAGLDPFDRLRAIGSVYTEFVARHRAYFRLMFLSDWGTDPDVESGARAFAVLRDSVTDCLKASGRGGEDPMPAIIAMWGGVHGIAAICFDGPLAALVEPEEMQAFSDQALTVLVRALRP